MKLKQIQDFLKSQGWIKDEIGRYHAYNTKSFMMQFVGESSILECYAESDNGKLHLIGSGEVCKLLIFNNKLVGMEFVTPEFDPTEQDHADEENGVGPKPPSECDDEC